MPGAAPHSDVHADHRVDTAASPHANPTHAAGAHGHRTSHAGHGHDGHAGHDPEMFRRRFWLSLALTIPLVVTSEMVMDWFGYSLDFWGMDLLGPVLGSLVFWWGGWPFLAGGVAELRARFGIADRRFARVEPPPTPEQLALAV